MLSGPHAVLHALAVSCVLLRLHPRPLAHTPSYEFTVSFMGVSGGGRLGGWVGGWAGGCPRWAVAASQCYCWPYCATLLALLRFHSQRSGDDWVPNASVDLLRLSFR